LIGSVLIEWVEGGGERLNLALDLAHLPLR
jgi:hypothetical protein